jgi:hypothetical protein
MYSQRRKIGLSGDHNQHVDVLRIGLGGDARPDEGNQANVATWRAAVTNRRRPASSSAR